jgi:hypothetical protein
MAVVWRAVGAACTWLCQKAQSGTIPLTVGDTPTMRSAMLPSPISADAPSEGANMRRLEFDKTARNFLAAVHLTPTAILAKRPPGRPLWYSRSRVIESKAIAGSRMSAVTPINLGQAGWLIPLSQVVLNMVCLSECAATGASIDEGADGQAAIAHTTQNGFLFEPRWPGGFAYPVCDNVVAASLKSRAVPGEPLNMGGPGTTG